MDTSQVTIELEHAVGFSGSVSNAVFFHSNNQDIIYVAGGCVVVRELNDPHNQVFLRGHDDDITCLDLSPSGRLLASGQKGHNADVIVWDLVSKQPVYRFSEHDHGVSHVVFSHDEKLLATVGDEVDRKIIFWDMQSGYIVATQTFSSPVTAVKWGGMVKDIKRRDLKDYLLAISFQMHGFMLWGLNTSTGEISQEKCQSGSQGRLYTSLVFSQDKEYCYAGTTSGDFCCFNMKNKVLHATIKACGGGVCSLLSAEDGQLVVGGGDGTITYFVGSGKDLVDHRKCHLNDAEGISSLGLSGDNAELIAGTTNGYLYRVRTRDMTPLLLCENHFAGVTAVAYPRTVSDRFATTSKEGSVRVWDVSDYTVVAKNKCRGIYPTCLSYSLECMFTGWSDGKIRAYDAENGEYLWTIDDAHRGGVSCLAVASHQKFIVTGGEEGEVRVWEVKSRELVSHMKEHHSRVNEIVLFDDDIHMLSCSRDRNFLCWDLMREKRITCHSQRMGGINSIAISRDQTQVLTVGQEKKITFWDIREPQPLQVIDKVHNGDGTSISVSHSGNLFATGGTDQLVKVWDFSTGQLIADGIGHSGTVNDVRFSPDDRQLVSVGEDGNVFLWNVF